MTHFHHERKCYLAEKKENRGKDTEQGPISCSPTPKTAELRGTRTFHVEIGNRLKSTVNQIGDKLSSGISFWVRHCHVEMVGGRGLHTRATKWLSEQANCLDARGHTDLPAILLALRRGSSASQSAAQRDGQIAKRPWEERRQRRGGRSREAQEGAKRVRATFSLATNWTKGLLTTLRWRVDWNMKSQKFSPWKKVTFKTARTYFTSKKLRFLKKKRVFSLVYCFHTEADGD